MQFLQFTLLSWHSTPISGISTPSCASTASTSAVRQGCGAFMFVVRANPASSL